MSRCLNLSVPLFPYLPGGSYDGDRDTCLCCSMCSVNHAKARACHGFKAPAGPLGVLQRKGVLRLRGARRRAGAPGGRDRRSAGKVCIMLLSTLLRASPGLSSLPFSPGPLSAPPPLPVLQVKASMHLTYLRAIGAPLCLYALFLFLCQQVASFCRNYWLSLWADDPTVDGRQTQAALRGWVFGLLGCLQGTTRQLSSPSTPPAPSQVLRTSWLPVPGSPCPSWTSVHTSWA